MKPSREDCVQAVALLVLELQADGAEPSHVLAALESAVRCETRLLRKEIISEPFAGLPEHHQTYGGTR